MDYFHIHVQADKPWHNYYLSSVSTGSTQEDLSQHDGKIVDWDVKNQIEHYLLALPFWFFYCKSGNFGEIFFFCK